MTEPLHDRLVTALGDQYDVEHEIGRGGMSVVYRARDRRLNRLVAIKVLPPELAYDPAIRTRFKREAQTAAQLSHAHIVPIYDVGERDGIAHFVMALITGGNLADLLAREPRQPIEEARRLLREIADALAYAHLRGVIHRDIKPDNILIDAATGRAMVTDFGIARAIEAGTRLTVTGAAVGTPTYMSPEQAKGERDIDGRSDIYSLGVIGYQMLTGRVPFVAANPMALLLKHVGERPRAIAELRPDAPRSIRDAVERSLMKDAEDRWPTAAALRDAVVSEAPSSWRAPQQHEPVRYVSPRPPSRDGSIVMEPAHLATLTSEQRDDLRLWNGRIHLLDRIKAMRGYAILTVGAWFLGAVGFVAGVTDAPPLVLAPLVPIYMTTKLWRRGNSLRASGLRLRRVLFMLKARWVFPTPKPSPLELELAKLAPRELLDSPQGTAIRQAVEDRIAISEIVAALSKAERALLPDLNATVNGLVQRIGHLANTLYDLEQVTDPRLAPRLIQQREDLKNRLESAGLALQNIRLDLIRFRLSGLQSALTDASSATQQARALSREIATALEAVSEVNNLSR
ncbi:MAG TPA: serine/threonine-protein kinase [Gemmatimonadales bacterium]|nr:serine/threonine-protein kinase [Gemmatimonadales bacterium]